MSGIRAARDLSHDLSHDKAAMQRASSVPAGSSEARQVQAMQDLLYDILATGVDSERTDVAIETIETFLHEHARQPKSAAEFRAFFAQHGLTSRVPTPGAPDVAKLPPLKRAAPPPRPSSIPPALPMTVHEVVPYDEALHPVRFDLGARPIERRRTRPLVGLGLAACALVIAAALYAGSVHLMELRADLMRSERQARENAALIESLRQQTVSFESSLAASGQLIERVEQKSDLVLDQLQRAEQEQAKRKRF